MIHAFRFHGQTLHALPSGALYWPDRQLLCVSDLHLGKAERMARRGGMLLPPYETRDTLARLDADLEATGARAVICLGDSFDDSAALRGLDDDDHLWLTRLMAGREWVWITGNHDAGPLDIAGSHRATWTADGLTFRHIGTASEQGEISGHFHPKVRLAGKAWRAFLVDANRVILPAFGTYTGGLWSHDPALTALMAVDARACLCGHIVRVIPMPRSSTDVR